MADPSSQGEASQGLKLEVRTVLAKMLAITTVTLILIHMAPTFHELLEYLPTKFAAVVSVFIISHRKYRQEYPLNWTLLTTVAIGAASTLSYFTLHEKSTSVGLAVGISVMSCVPVAIWASQTNVNLKELEFTVFIVSYAFAAILFLVYMIYPSLPIEISLSAVILLTPMYYLAMGIQLTIQGKFEEMDPGDPIIYGVFIYMGIFVYFIILVLLIAAFE